MQHIKEIQTKTRTKTKAGYPFILGGRIPVLEFSDVALLKEIWFDPTLTLNGIRLKEVLTSTEDLLANIYLICKQNFPQDTHRLLRARKVQEHMGFTTSHETIAESRLRGDIIRTFVCSNVIKNLNGYDWKYDPTNTVDFVFHFIWNLRVYRTDRSSF